MKQVIICFLFSCFGLIACNNGPQDCKRFRDGTFILAGNGGNYTIVRQGNWQLETKSGSTDTSTFAVEWLDDCTYTLKPYPSYFKKHPNESTEEMMTVVIDKTTANSYFETTTGNFFPGGMKGELVKVK